jgi:anti-anti-sigma factor
VGELTREVSLDHGNHVCWAYGSDQEHQEVLTHFLKEGLESNQRVLYLSRRFTDEKVMSYLREAGVAADDVFRSGQLVFLDAETAYVGEEGFQPERMEQAFRQAAAQAVDDGYRGLRAASETEWLLPTFVDPARFVEYEYWIDRVVAGLPQIGLCGYDARHLNPDWLLALQAVHPHQITGPSVRQTPFRVGSGMNGEIVVEGEVDATCHEAFRLALRAVAARGAEEVVLDLEALDFISLTALRVLVDFGWELNLEGRSFFLRSLPEVAKRIMHPALGCGRLSNLQLA